MLSMILRPSSDLVPVLGHSNGRCSDTPVPGTKNAHNQLGKGNDSRGISGKFGLVASTAYEKVKKKKKKKKTHFF